MEERYGDLNNQETSFREQEKTKQEQYEQRFQENYRLFSLHDLHLLS